MADTKISALSSAAALGGTEAVPIVQSGSTVKTTISAILTYIQAQALNLTANFAIATNKFTVNATTGNTAVAGTLGVTGATTMATLATSGVASLASATITTPLPVGSGGTGAATLDAAGIVTKTGTQTAAGAKTWSDAASFSSTLAVTGASTLTGAVTASAAPTLTSAGSYGIGTMPTFTSTSGIRACVNAVGLGNPTGNSTAAYFGVAAQAATEVANAFNLTGTFGLRSVWVRAQHQGAGTVTGAVGAMIDTNVNSGGGIITNNYGLYLAAQTVGANNWALRQVGSTTPSQFDGKVGIGMLPSNTLDVTGTFGATGIATFGSQINLKSYTVATLPSATTGGGLVYVSNASPTPCVAFSDGTNWKRSDNAATTVS